MHRPCCRHHIAHRANCSRNSRVRLWTALDLQIDSRALGWRGDVSIAIVIGGLDFLTTRGLDGIRIDLVQWRSSSGVPLAAQRSLAIFVLSFLFSLLDEFDLTALIWAANARFITHHAILTLSVIRPSSTVRLPTTGIPQIRSDPSAKSRFD